MSFYLGTGGSGKIMHITKGSYTDTAMQGGVLPDTVFHSDLGYITYELFTGPISTVSIYIGTGSFMEVPISCIELLMSNRLYFLFTKNTSGVWVEYTNPTQNASSAIIWYNSDRTASSNYPTTVCRFIYVYPVVLDFYIAVVNINRTTGYIPIPTSSTDIIVRSGDIIVKGVDLYDLKYINSSQVNSEDILVTVNSGTIQLVNSSPAPFNNMSIVSNPSYTKIFNGTKPIWDTTINRDKLRFEGTYTHHIPYGYISTYSSVTVDVPLFGAGTLALGDMFFLTNYSVGAIPTDGSNKILRYVDGLIILLSYESYSAYGGYGLVDSYLYGASDGSLFERIVITIVPPKDGTIRGVSKEHYITLYRLV